MSKSLTVAVDPQAVSMAETLRRMAPIVPRVVVKQGALADLASELGGYEAATQFLADLAHETGKPIGLNVQTGPDTSSTAFLALRDWTEERLAGWVAAKHEELEREFGAAVLLRPNRAERRQRRRN